MSGSVSIAANAAGDQVVGQPPPAHLPPRCRFVLVETTSEAALPLSRERATLMLVPPEVETQIAVGHAFPSLRTSTARNV